jgi:2-polyprenyl-3-methyl-5-hydroxy-6-metoxy-1,4-benzoquinol methylase
MKSKALEQSDYKEISEEVRSLMRAEAEFRGAGVTFTLPHMNRYWEYGSALAALREAGIAPPARVLDVGAGHGPLGPWLAKLHYRVDEIDPGENVASRADLKPKLEGLDWAFAARPLLEFKSSSPYDAVFAVSVMEHIPGEDQYASWEKLAALVRPGGLLFATVDYGAADASNASARELMFTEEGLQNILELLPKLGIELGEVDTTFHGAQVYDYTFFRFVGRRTE